MIFRSIKELFLHPSNTGLYFLLLCLIILALGAVSLKAHGTEPVAPSNVAQAIRWWAREAPRNPVLRPEKLTPLSEAISKGAAKHGLPWELVTAIVLRESSGHAEIAAEKNSRGGEIGVMQVHPSNLKRFGCDVSTVAGQVDCGCKVLAHNYEQCGTLRGGLTRYASRYRKCRATPGSKLAWVVNDRFKLAKQLKKAGSPK